MLQMLSIICDINYNIFNMQISNVQLLLAEQLKYLKIHYSNFFELNTSIK